MIPLSRFLEYSKKYSLIPLDLEIEKLEQFQLNLESISKQYPYSILLESGEHGKDTGRFTYFAIDPFLSMQLKNKQLNITGEKSAIEHLQSIEFETKYSNQPIEAIHYLLHEYRSPLISDLPPFTGGGIGYFSYEFMKRFERIKNEHQIASVFSEWHIAFFKEILVYDHAEKKLSLIYHVMVDRELPTEEKTNMYFDVKQILGERVEYWKSFIQNHSIDVFHANQVQIKRKTFTQGFLPDQFKKAVKTIKQRIIEGEVFQTVLSQRLITQTNVNPANVYQVLRHLNPSPYMYYLKMDEEILIGTSPESLVKVVDKEISTYPIAGTRPRGRTKEEEKELEQDLISDEKEIAEHIMLIDLARNDIGKVSKSGTVRVAEKMKIEKYSHVMHIVSKVVGQINEGYQSIDVLKAVFPAGTVSGAPKVRAMEIIAELEPDERGPYAGAVTALGFNGNLDTCITIRSIFFNKGNAYIQSGAGIVADSQPEKEYMEIINKAKAMLKAIEISEAYDEQV